MISILTKKDSKFQGYIFITSRTFTNINGRLYFLIYNKQFIIAIGLFSIVQILYFIRYKRNNIKQDIIKILVIFSTILIIYFLFTIL